MYRYLVNDKFTLKKIKIDDYAYIYPIRITALIDVYTNLFLEIELY